MAPSGQARSDENRKYHVTIQASRGFSSSRANVRRDQAPQIKLLQTWPGSWLKHFCDFVHCYLLNKHDLLFTLDKVTRRIHRGLRYVIAYAIALAEFSSESSEDVLHISFSRDTLGFHIDPFCLENDINLWKMVVIVWRSGDGKYHLQIGRLCYFMWLVSNIANQDINQDAVPNAAHSFHF